MAIATAATPLGARPCSAPAPGGGRPTLAPGTLPRRAVGLPLRESEAGTTVVLPGAEVEENPAHKRAKDYSVLLFNDPLNKREYVCRCLMLICLLEERPAYETMMKAHQEGVAVVGTYKFDTAEDFCARLKAKGIISDIISKDSE
ncbi:unnamed protein product [Prorocentrum cordatum]|uniref:Adaptor protein ClpS core domain-containing protein n=1 Tax=Prorocentrum cordatum TaxID=2364126 RepID=A0ABN9V5G9_9DINO|nr:unnamed protein product [Polarella glacialis]